MNGKGKSRVGKVKKVFNALFLSLSHFALLATTRYSFKLRVQRIVSERKRKSFLLIYSLEELEKNYVDLSVVWLIAFFFFID